MLTSCHVMYIIRFSVPFLDSRFSIPVDSRFPFVDSRFRFSIPVFDSRFPFRFSPGVSITVFDSPLTFPRFPFLVSRFPFLDSRFPFLDSRFPFSIPDSRFDSRLDSPLTFRFPLEILP